MPIKCANTPKRRRRTNSGSILSPRKELLRSCIRLHVASEPYDTLTQEDTWHEALRLAKSLEEKPQVIRKAIYSRRSFVNKKIKDLLIHHHVLNPYSPIIAAIANEVQTIESNVVYILEMQLGRSDVFDEVVVSTNPVKANGTKIIGKEKEKKATA